MNNKRIENNFTVKKNTSIFEKKITVAIYARSCSANDDSIEKQIQECKKFIRSHGGDPEAAIIYEDNGYSGSNVDRPSFQKLLQDMQEGKIQALVVNSVDRIARKLELLLHYLEKIVKDEYIGVFSAKGSLSFESMELSFNLLDLFSEFYKNDLSDELTMVRCGK